MPEKFIWVQCPCCLKNLKPKQFRKCFKCNKVATQTVFVLHGETGHYHLNSKPDC